VAKHIREARELRKRVAAAENENSEQAMPRSLEGEIVKYSQSTVCDKSELFWPEHLVNFHVSEIVRIFGRFLKKQASASTKG
jgi:hypothetical protein